jgi:hypothetical protein
MTIECRLVRTDKQIEITWDNQTVTLEPGVGPVRWTMGTQVWELKR